MRRDLYDYLVAWKDHPLRKPLILRGARQVGKSWLVNEFGKEFSNFIEINFEKHKGARTFFEGDIDIPTLLEKLKIFSHKEIIPGKTLLFFDEIQACEPAISTLRYFKEELPELHIIAAGSLIDFVLENIGMPVGRVQFLYLHPLSFGEFLSAMGQDDLGEYIKKQVTKKQAIDQVFHQQLLELLKTYFWLGGMPAAVDAWLKTRSIEVCHDIHDEILLSYQQDFHKYARDYQIEKLDKVFSSIPKQLSQKFVFKQVEPDIRSNLLKSALLALQKAGIAHIVYHTSGQGLPLAASSNERKFKVYFLDIGLAQRLLGLDQRNWLMTPLDVRHVGAIAEQYAAQQYIAHTSIKTPPELFYWHREEKHSKAEIDFLFVKNGVIVPIEVKSGKKGTLKSLNLFLDSHPNSQVGAKICEQPFAENGTLQTVPLYGIEGWFSM